MYRKWREEDQSFQVMVKSPPEILRHISAITAFCEDVCVWWCLEWMVFHKQEDVQRAGPHAGDRNRPCMFCSCSSVKVKGLWRVSMLCLGASERAVMASKRCLLM